MYLDKDEDALKCDMQISDACLGKSLLFELPPPGARRLVVMEVQPVSDVRGHWLIVGNTWPFKSAMDAMEIPWQYQKDEAGKQQVVWVLSNVDFSKQEQ